MKTLCEYGIPAAFVIAFVACMGQLLAALLRM
jgi:hypothetical protein